MLLNVYLGSTAISWASVILFAVASGKRLEREGYKEIKTKKSLAEKILDYIVTAIRLSIPVINIIYPLTIIFASDVYYENFKAKLLSEGKIYKEKDNLEKLERIDENVLLVDLKTGEIKGHRPFEGLDHIDGKLEFTTFDSQTLDIKKVDLNAMNSIQQANDIKRYEDMSIEEKIALLEKERNNLLMKEGLLKETSENRPVRRRTNK